MSSLDAPAVSALLKELFARADRDDEAAFGRVQTELDRLDGPPDSRRRAELMRDVYMPVSPDVGRLLYMLARNRRARRRSSSSAPRSAFRGFIWRLPCATKAVGGW
jgi:hypothetical protein